MKMVKAALYFNDNPLELAKNSESFYNLYKVRPLIQALFRFLFRFPTGKKLTIKLKLTLRR